MSKIRKRLTDQEAQFLGLKIKKTKGYGKPRYMVDRYQMQLLEDNKQVIGIINASNNAGVSEMASKHLWLKTDDASLFIPNPLYKKEDENKFFNDLTDLLTKHAPTYPKLKRIENNDSNLLVINPADVHIGKLATAFETGDEYNIKIAIQRVKDGVNGILNYAKGFNIDKIVFVGGNDILHIDTPKRTTTSGTPQDTDGMWYDSYLQALQLYIEVLEQLISIANVHFVFCPSNHDYTNGFFLAQNVQSYFNKNKNITFDCSITHRKYFVYGTNLLGFTHGDGGNVANLPLAMAHESKDWSNCKHRYIYIHHFHHKTAKDYQGVCVESMRSPSGTDSWHHRNIYCNNIKAIEGFIHHKDNGQVARFNYIF